MIQGLLVTISLPDRGFRPAITCPYPLAIGFMLLIALVFAALGVAIGSSLQDMQGFQLIMNFLVMPIFFLSGALFPLDGSTRTFSNSSPGSIRFRMESTACASVLLGTLHSHPATDIAVLAC